MLATAMAMPMTAPDLSDQPKKWKAIMARMVAAALCTTAPGMATHLTALRSLRWKCRPTPNIMRMTPTSASWWAMCSSPTNPGVCRPMSTPAIR